MFFVWVIINEMEYLYIGIIFLFGAIIGSFINVIADRYNTGLSFLKGRSFCFSCSKPLSKRDLFPIFSFLFLRGKCRHCKAKIPNTVFVVEVLMGLFTVLAAIKSGFLGHGFPLFLDFSHLLLFVNFLILTSIFGTILLLSIYDLRHFIIPDSFLIAFFVLSIGYKFLNSNFYQIGFDLVAGIVLLLPFLIIFMVSKGRWIGFGDVKYIFFMGFFLGISAGVSAVVLSFWIGAFISLSILFFKKMGLLNRFNNLTIKSEIPFGPFLSLGVIIGFCLGLDLFQIKNLLDVL